MLFKKLVCQMKMARRYYISNKEPSITGDELDKWVELSEDMGIAHMKEMIICNKCYGIPIEKVIDRLHEMRKRKTSSDDASRRKSLRKCLLLDLMIKKRREL